MKPFTFYDIYYVPIKEMDDKQAGKFFRMICDFLDGKQVTIDAESDEEVSPEFELYWESILSDLETYRNSAGKSCGLDKRYKHFPFLPFYRKAFAYLSYDEGGAFVKMIGAYMFENKAPTKADGNAFKYFNICKRKLDENKQQEQELAERATALMQTNAQIEEAEASISAAEKRLAQTQFRADLAEGRQAHAEREAQRLERERERLTREVAPLSAAAEAFRQASGKKPDKRQIPALLAENARLEKALEYSIKDQHGLYTELQASEKENAALKRDADTLRTLRTHALDKLQEAMDTAKRRQESKRPPFRSNSSSWTK